MRRRRCEGDQNRRVEPESFRFDSIYVPFKRRATLDQARVSAIAESMLVSGQTTPIMVRADGCPCRKLNPDVLVMQSPRIGTGTIRPNGSTAREAGESLSKDRCVRALL
jgi:hypothetical protein